jgi:hypothetical protein
LALEAVALNRGAALAAVEVFAAAAHYDRVRILASLAVVGGRGMRPVEGQRALEMSRGTFRGHAHRLRQVGLVTQGGADDQWRWWITPFGRSLVVLVEGRT